MCVTRNTGDAFGIKTIAGCGNSCALNKHLRKTKEPLRRKCILHIIVPIEIYQGFHGYGSNGILKSAAARVDQAVQPGYAFGPVGSSGRCAGADREQRAFFRHRPVAGI